MNRDAAERQFHDAVKPFGFKGKIYGDAVWTFCVQVPRKCSTVFQSTDRNTAVDWAKCNARVR